MDHCADFLRAADRDRYLAALVAPAPARPHLMALYALDAELALVRERISEPLAGEIRLQWWRDAIAALYHGAPAEHPVLAALAPAIAAGRLPLPAFQATVDARIFDQYDDTPPDMASLEGYLGERFGIIVRLACLVLSAGSDERAGTAAGHAGMALGIAWLLRGLPHHVSAGKAYLPDDLLARHGVERSALAAGRADAALVAALDELRALARRHLASARHAATALPHALLPAFAPLGPVAPLLAASERLPDPLRAPPQVSPLRRQWRIWRAARGAF